MGNQDDLWCILRTSPARTLPLAISLAHAGFEVWSPAQTQKRRAPRSRKQYVRDVPITPTFVFARASHLPVFARIMALPRSPHPPFSIFRHAGRIPLVTDGEIQSLHDAEDRAKRAVLRAERHIFAPGASVRVKEGVGMGLSGVVEGGDGKYALVAFGGTMRLKIATWLLSPDEVRTETALTGTAA